MVNPKTGEGYPVVIRLIDPPLHEFLPSYEDLLVEVTRLEVTGANPRELEEKRKLLDAVGAMREMNPMLGLRGCRLGLLYPEINVTQTRAILEAALELAKEGKKIQPKIMIPLVGHVNELKEVRRQLEVAAKEITARAGSTIEYKFGTMIELPRAALTADQIATVADFFSFGTNDLTQTTFGFSRDDAEGKFLLKYVRPGQHRVLPYGWFGLRELLAIQGTRGAAGCSPGSSNSRGKRQVGARFIAPTADLSAFDGFSASPHYLLIGISRCRQQRIEPQTALKGAILIEGTTRVAMLCLRAQP